MRLAVTRQLPVIRGQGVRRALVKALAGSILQDGRRAAWKPSAAALGLSKAFGASVVGGVAAVAANTAASAPSVNVAVVIDSAVDLLTWLPTSIEPPLIGILAEWDAGLAGCYTPEPTSHCEHCGRGQSHPISLTSW